ncbi:hypothetical protein GCM10010116_46270 [Microbispora rosea subsp. aerata]|nr:hypothetical protein GCM10010116_46270 [Microbispora rosea subsp. aerata]GIH58972.1 hypothetical protein Mro02_58860 [Microbispora rosea subsp. aerata]GLJ85837.1 hypothetical protein GCM10017588_45700 [Microbispora rosea subsp. aerata]
MLGRLENTCAGMPTSSGLAPSSTSTATRWFRGLIGLLRFARSDVIYVAVMTTAASILPAGEVCRGCEGRAWVRHRPVRRGEGADRPRQQAVAKTIVLFRPGEW